jgi:hypothetical protein
MFKSAPVTHAELEDSTLGLHTFDDYTPLIGREAKPTRCATAM